LVHYHQQHRALVTIALTPVADPTSYGLIETKTTGRVTRFLEKPTWDQVTTNMINAGTYVLEPDVLRYIPQATNFSFERELFPLLLQRAERLYAYPSPAYWIDIGTPEKYHQLHRDLLKNKTVHPGFPLSCEAIRGAGSRVHETAVIEGRVIIGEGCSIDKDVYLKGPLVLGPGCIIKAGARVVNSVIWRETIIEDSDFVSGSLLADHCVLKSGCRVENVIMGDRVTVMPYVVVPPQSRIASGAVIS